MKYQKLAVGLGMGFAVWMVVALLGLTQLESHASSTRYSKTSVDNTPLFIYTDTTTGCKYVYDASTLEIRTAKGFETCVVPTSFEE